LLSCIAQLVRVDLRSSFDQLSERVVCPVLGAPKFKPSQLQHGDTATLSGHDPANRRSLSASQASTLDSKVGLPLCVLIIADPWEQSALSEQRFAHPRSQECTVFRTRARTDIKQLALRYALEPQAVAQQWTGDSAVNHIQRSVLLGQCMLFSTHLTALGNRSTIAMIEQTRISLTTLL